MDRALVLSLFLAACEAPVELVEMEPPPPLSDSQVTRNVPAYCARVTIVDGSWHEESFEVYNDWRELIERTRFDVDDSVLGFEYWQFDTDRYTEVFRDDEIFHSRTFLSANNQLVERWDDDDGDGSPDTEGVVVRTNERGDPTEFVTLEGAEVVSRIFRRFDGQRRLVEFVLDAQDDGQRDSVTTYTYGDGTVLVESDDGADGTVDITTRRTFDSRGRLLTEETGPAVRTTRSLQWAGDRLVLEQFGNDEGYFEVTEYDYDPFGRVTEAVSRANSGEPRVTTWHYQPCRSVTR